MQIHGKVNIFSLYITMSIARVLQLLFLITE